MTSIERSSPPRVRLRLLAHTPTPYVAVTSCCSGQIPLDPNTSSFATGGVDAERRQCLDNLAAVCASAGTELRNAVRLTVYATNLADDWQSINEAYGSYSKAGRLGGNPMDDARRASLLRTPAVATVTVTPSCCSGAASSTSPDSVRETKPTAIPGAQSVRPLSDRGWSRADDHERHVPEPGRHCQTRAAAIGTRLWRCGSRVVP
jgi:enamine deaminase RidA (YjgF/YER057c/UK114 family)